ncbi:MAG: hypothetical protein PHZ17_05685 [Sulfurovum sp.]|nr:hypothetical protein [Sulfurovum sp.]
MMDIILTLVFSIVMLLFMIFPAMKVTELIHQNFPLSKTFYNVLTIFIVLFLSLSIGLFLRFA